MNASLDVISSQPREQRICSKKGFARSLLKALIVSSLVVILPVLGNIEILLAPHLWLLLVFGILASLLQPDYNPFTIGTKPTDKATGAQIIWSVYIVQLAAILEATYLRYPGSIEWDLVSTLALILITLGLLLRTWAVLTLGNLFTMHLSIHKNHRLVRDGPFKFVRHPSYLGAYILYTSSAIFLHAWLSAIAGLLIMLMAFLRRIHYEEEMLKRKFGEDYQSYCCEVGKLFPFVS